MKIRSGFISNSSSSSFTCDVCKETMSGMDLCLRDIEHLQCINGHTFCRDELVNSEKFEELCDKADNWNDQGIFPDDYEDYKKYGIFNDQRTYEIPSEFCPCCNFQVVTDRDLLEYLLFYYQTDRKQVAESMRKQFSSYSEFIEFTK